MAIHLYTAVAKGPMPLVHEKTRGENVPFSTHGSSLHNFFSSPALHIRVNNSAKKLQKKYRLLYALI